MNNCEYITKQTKEKNTREPRTSTTFHEECPD